ncbi:hypothetical protein LguiA_025084 [Lonicera macranthoides]
MDCSKEKFKVQGTSDEIGRLEKIRYYLGLILIDGLVNLPDITLKNKFKQQASSSFLHFHSSFTSVFEVMLLLQADLQLSLGFLAVVSGLTGSFPFCNGSLLPCSCREGSESGSIGIRALWDQKSFHEKKPVKKLVLSDSLWYSLDRDLTSLVNSPMTTVGTLLDFRLTQKPFLRTRNSR